MSSKMVIILGVVSLLLLGFVGVNITGFFAKSSKNLDSFAECLTNNNVTMFGAYWCPHCREQKKLFGDSWRLVNYVECSLPGGASQTKECREAGITSYPTWQFGDENNRVTGFLSLEELSKLTGCSLNEGES